MSRLKLMPKKLQLWDVCIMKAQVDREALHVSTPHYNLPYTIARNLGRTEASNPRYPKGTFYKLVENGKKPTRQLNLALRNE